jgi:LacI family transcriptional regulator
MTSDCSGNFKVSVLVETSREYGRGLLRGIYRYNSLHRQWQIEQPASFSLASLGSFPTSRAKGDACVARTGDADGIIMRDHRGAPTLLRKGIPIVFASYLHKDIRSSHRILPDDGAIGRMGAAHLLERGFRHFAFVGYDSMFWSRQRQESFSQAVGEAGHACAVFKQARDLRLRVWAKEHKVLADWLKTLDRPVGVMACNDDRAREVVDACAMAGLGVPEDVAVLGVDNDEFVCNLSNPPISSVALGLEDAGFRAAALLDQLMKAARERKPRTRTNTETHGPARTAASVRVREGPCLSVPSSSQIIVMPLMVVTRHSSDTSAIEDPCVVEAVRFIRANSQRPLQIDDILKEVAICRRSLLDRFKHTLGCTIHQYIKRVRVARIEELLLGTSDSIGQIAETLGFPSPEHVALYFRSVKGMNPHTFRTRHAHR